MKLLTRTTTPPPASDVLAWTGPRAAATAAFTWLLLAALAAGPVALVAATGLWLTSPAAVEASAPVPPDDVVNKSARASAFAEDLVVAWLSTPAGQEDRLVTLVAGSSSPKLPKTPWSVTSVSTSGVTGRGGLWSVTVAVTLNATRRYFQVPVAIDAGGVVAVAWPAPVPGPPRTDAPALAYRHTVSTTDPLAVAAAQFLAALLTGSGDVTRLTSPGSHIRAISPAPYTEVQVNAARSSTDVPGQAGEGQHVRILVDAIAAVSDDQQISVTYPLTLTVREGRWEVTSIDSPQLATTD